MLVFVSLLVFICQGCGSGEQQLGGAWLEPSQGETLPDFSSSAASADPSPEGDILVFNDSSAFELRVKFFNLIRILYFLQSQQDIKIFASKNKVNCSSHGQIPSLIQVPRL